MPTTSITEEIAALQKRLAQLQDEAEDVLRKKLKEARAVPPSNLIGEREELNLSNIISTYPAISSISHRVANSFPACVNSTRPIGIVLTLR